MDLSKISTEDLQHIQAGHWDKVSTPGLQEYQAQRQHETQAAMQAQNPQQIPDAADKAAQGENQNAQSLGSNPLKQYLQKGADFVSEAASYPAAYYHGLYQGGTLGNWNPSLGQESANKHPVINSIGNMVGGIGTGILAGAATAAMAPAAGAAGAAGRVGLQLASGLGMTMAAKPPEGESRLNSINPIDHPFQTAMATLPAALQTGAELIPAAKSAITTMAGSSSGLNSEQIENYLSNPQMAEELAKMRQEDPLNFKMMLSGKIKESSNAVQSNILDPAKRQLTEAVSKVNPSIETARIQGTGAGQAMAKEWGVYGDQFEIPLESPVTQSPLKATGYKPGQSYEYQPVDLKVKGADPAQVQPVSFKAAKGDPIQATPIEYQQLTNPKPSTQEFTIRDSTYLGDPLMGETSVSEPSKWGYAPTGKPETLGNSIDYQVNPRGGVKNQFNATEYGFEPSGKPQTSYTEIHPKWDPKVSPEVTGTSYPETPQQGLFPQPEQQTAPGNILLQARRASSALGTPEDKAAAAYLSEVLHEASPNATTADQTLHFGSTFKTTADRAASAQGNPEALILSKNLNKQATVQALDAAGNNNLKQIGDLLEAGNTLREPTEGLFNGIKTNAARSVFRKAANTDVTDVPKNAALIGSGMFGGAKGLSK